MAGTDEVRPDPRPSARVRLSPSKYRELVARMLELHPRCECGCGRPATSCHHVVPRGQGGGDLEQNLVCLYGDGTRGCHGALENAAMVNDVTGWIDPQTVRSGIRLTLETGRRDVHAYVCETKSEAWLDWRYPQIAGTSV